MVPVLSSFWRLWMLLGFLFIAGCDYMQGVKQVRTTAGLQAITARIEDRQLRPLADEMEAVVTSAIAADSDGRDAWGHPYLWEIRLDHNRIEYVVLSTGSDGRLDVPTLDDYFSRSGLEVLRASEHDRDIVFRNGQAVVTGGK